MRKVPEAVGLGYHLSHLPVFLTSTQD